MRRQINQQELEFYYLQTGEAVWQLQYVEEALCKFYIIFCIRFNTNGVTRENAEYKLSQINKKTLGQLIGLLDSVGNVPNSFMIKLRKFNNERKWLIHNSLRENGNDLYTEQGRNDFAIKVVSFNRMAKEIHDQSADIIMKLVTRSGYATEQEIIQMALKEINDHKGNV
ncbi:hypothetical protein [Neptuniibacter sp.]|uniref:hypothetical protein n=1 Tax=Neptuniibacter sp. TaxID=1962643 RepID=UPI00260D1C41|nr:hypothetical protein [Neptuniibacter sp.]MCP4597858.1 hypothetical protein [Neptuniibacter sp.]